MIAHLVLAVASFGPACYLPPVSAPIAVPYVQPACRFCPGHRGLEYSLSADTPVQAVSAGTVTFAGAVAGVRYVVVLQPDGLRATYGLLITMSVSSGDVIAPGRAVGLSSTRLYFGLRDADDEPVDPTSLLGRLVGRPRLVPVDGSGRRAGPPARLVCSAVVSGASAA